MKGIDIAVIADIDKTRAQEAYKIGMLESDVVEACSAAEADKAVTRRRRVFTSDYRIVTDMKQVDTSLDAMAID